MNDLEILSPARLSSRVQEFVSEASDLYVDFLSQGRKSLATSLLSGLVVAVATLDRVSQLPPGAERMGSLQRAARVFHRLSLLIFVSAVYNDENDGSDLRTQHAYDTAADLSGLLGAAAKRR